MTEDAGKTCPACGQTVKAAALICRFCHASFQPGPPAPAPRSLSNDYGSRADGGGGMTPPPEPPKGGSRTLIIVLGVVGVLLIVCAGLPIMAAILLPAVARATHQARIASCQNNLSQLWRTEQLYAVRFGGREKPYPMETGGAFWLKLSETSPPLIDPSSADVYECPLEGVRVHGRHGERFASTDYRGPSGDVNEYVDTAAVGADKLHNHREGGGNVLRKAGDVQCVAQGDALWNAAAMTTEP